jgi:hypothetical protein
MRMANTRKQLSIIVLCQNVALTEERYDPDAMEPVTISPTSSR